MCIVCNAGDSHEALDAADEFLKNFRLAGAAMKVSEKALLKCSQTFPKEKDRRRYAQTHKLMVQTRRLWNNLEHIREAGEEKKDAG